MKLLPSSLGRKSVIDSSLLRGMERYSEAIEMSLSRENTFMVRVLVVG